MNDLSKIGHNAPPVDFFPTREQLEYENEELIRRRDELLAAAERIPAIADDDVARRVSDFIKQIMAAVKASEAARVKAKEPYLEGARSVDGFFKAIADPLSKAKQAVEGRLTVFLRAKAEAERREREDRERLAREEENRRRAEAFAAEAMMRDERDLKRAIEAKRLADQAEADRIRAEKDTQAKAADMSRTRGEYGAVASLRTIWKFSDLDRMTLDLEALRQHLPTDGLERAVNSFIRAGGRELRGAKIYESMDATVR